MGQAKARGTYEQRVASSTPRQRPLTKRQQRAIAMQSTQEMLHRMYRKPALKQLTDQEWLDMSYRRLDMCNRHEDDELYI